MGGHGWGDVSKAEVIKAVHSALDKKVNFFDTADIYGRGESEKILGEALRGRREEAVIASKFGVRMDANNKAIYDNSPQWINETLNNSLKRLKTDYIDLYQIHYRDDKTSLVEIVETLEKLKKEEKIRYFGLSNLKMSDVNEITHVKSHFSTFQNEFSLANRDHEPVIFKSTHELGLSPLTWGSLGQGILTGKYDSQSKFDSNDRRSRPIYKNFHGEKLQHNLRIVEGLRNIADQINKPVSAVAIRWILDFLPGSVVITGVKSREQLEMNELSLGWTLDRSQVSHLCKIFNTEVTEIMNSENIGVM